MATKQQFTVYMIDVLGCSHSDVDVMLTEMREFGTSIYEYLSMEQIEEMEKYSG